MSGSPANVIPLPAKTASIRIGIPEEDMHHGAFVTHLLQALAFLRESWCRADPGNRPFVHAAIVATANCRSVSENPELQAKVRAILVCGLQPRLGDEMLDGVFP